MSWVAWKQRHLWSGAPRPTCYSSGWNTYYYNCWCWAKTWLCWVILEYFHQSDQKKNYVFQLVSFKNTCAYRFLWIALHWVCRIDTNRSNKISMHRDAPVNRYTPTIKNTMYFQILFSLTIKKSLELVWNRYKYQCLSNGIQLFWNKPCILNGACHTGDVFWHWALSWCPIFKSSHCTSFENWLPIDFIYGYPIFKRGAVTWQERVSTKKVVPTMTTRQHVLSVSNLQSHHPGLSVHFFTFVRHILSSLKTSLNLLLTTLHFAFKLQHRHFLILLSLGLLS